MNTGNKWNNYFIKIQNKYNLKMNVHKPLVIFIDGKNITKSLNYNLIQENKGSFNDIFEQTIKHFSKEFDCLALSGVDEVSFIFEDLNKLLDLTSYKNFKAQNIVSLFSQLFFKYFNDRYLNKPVYWHCKCSNIPIGKVNSYLIYRSLTIFELYLTYFLKRRNIADAGKIKLARKIEECDKLDEFKNFKRFAKGRLYANGTQIDLEKYIYNKMIVEIPEIKRENDIEYIDIKNLLT